MPKMTIKPAFDLAAHLAQPPSQKEVQNAKRIRHIRDMIVGKHRTALAITASDQK